MALRNIAIIAHVDHGKTTLVDELLKQSGSFRENQRVAERVMDSNDLEKERGITILAKATSVEWKGTRINIDATDEQLDFPILYGSGRAGWMNVNPEGPTDEGLAPLLDLVLKHVPEPSVGEADGAFRMIGTLLEANPFLGRIITGRIHSGSIKPNQAVKVLGQDGKLIENGRISKILAFRGIERTPIEEAHAGDIVAIAGLSKGTVAATF